MLVVHKAAIGIDARSLIHAVGCLGQMEFLVRFMGEVERARKRRGSLESQQKDGNKWARYAVKGKRGRSEGRKAEGTTLSSSTPSKTACHRLIANLRSRARRGASN